MSHARSESELSYSWRRAGCENHIKIEIGADRGVPAENSHGEFIIEHYWGYTKRGAHRTDEYKVEHRKWELFEAKTHEIKCDFGELYGKQFAHLSNENPYSIFMAKGSEISVYKGAKLIL
jgi:uncharacterized protein